MDFNNKIVLITGGSSGIGLAAALVFAKNGAKIAIVGRTEAKLRNAGEKIEKVGNKPLLIQADVSKDDEAKTIVKKTVEAFGDIDILVNNAGIIHFGNLLSVDVLQQYDKMMNVNLRAVVHITSLAAPYLIKTKGNIINISSILSTSFLGCPFGLAYGVSKAGLNHFTQGVALELQPFGVRVNTISPGLTRTNIFNNCEVARTCEDVKESYNLEKIIEPEEVAELIVYLASEKAKSITAGYYTIDNGTLILRK